MVGLWLTPKDEPKVKVKGPRRATIRRFRGKIIETPQQTNNLVSRLAIPAGHRTPETRFASPQKLAERRRRATMRAIHFARRDFAEDFHTLECGHRPSQALNSADQISQRL